MIAEHERSNSTTNFGTRLGPVKIVVDRPVGPSHLFREVGSFFSLPRSFVFLSAGCLLVHDNLGSPRTGVRHC